MEYSLMVCSHANLGRCDPAQMSRWKMRLWPRSLIALWLSDWLSKAVPKAEN